MSQYPHELEAAEVPVQPHATTPAAAPAPQSPAPGHGDFRALRLKRIKQTVVSSIIIRPLSLIIPLATVWLFFKPLGAERYGLYEAVGALALFIGLTNLGLSLGLMNKLTDCQVSGDRELARRYTSSLTIFLLGMTVVIALAFTAVVPWVDWGKIFRVADPVGQRETPWAVWVAGMIMILSLVPTIPASIYAGYQELHIATWWEGAGRLATLIACVVVAWIGTPLLQSAGGIVAVLLAVSGAPLLVRSVNAIWLFGWEKRWLAPKLSLFDFSLLKSTATEGILLFILQLAALLLFSIQNQIISTGIGTAHVPEYAIPGRLFIAGYGLFMVVLGPLWPASGEAVRRGDIDWVRKTLRWSLMFGCSVPLLVGLFLLFTKQWVFPLMTRNAAGVEISNSVILALACTFAARAWVDCRSIVLNSTGVIVPQIVFYLSHGILNVVVAILLVKPFGVAGVAWATPITAVITTLWGYPLLMRRYILSRPQTTHAQGAHPATTVTG